MKIASKHTFIICSSGILPFDLKTINKSESNGNVSFDFILFRIKRIFFLDIFFKKILQIYIFNFLTKIIRSRVLKIFTPFNFIR